VDEDNLIRFTSKRYLQTISSIGAETTYGYFRLYDLTILALHLHCTYSESLLGHMGKAWGIDNLIWFSMR
jgi:hypothetical protein